MGKNWNELEFTSYNNFKRMAPAIIQLEITRLGKMIASVETGNDTYNFLVKARYDLVSLKKDVELDTEKKPDKSKMTRLYSALYCVASAAEMDLTIKTRADYILDRLNDLLNKYKMLY